MNEVMKNCLAVAIVWGAYLALHSVMISITVTEYLKRMTGDRYRFYRLFFNMVAVLTLVPVVIFSGAVKGEIFFAWEGLLPLKWAVFAGGILLFWAGSRHYSFSRFLGLRQIREGARHGLMNGSGRIDSTGILGIIRHPYYSGTILLFWSHDLDHTQLAVNIVVTVYVIIGTFLEERKLIIEFGDGYREYRERVSMFVPWKWMKSRLRTGRLAAE